MVMAVSLRRGGAVGRGARCVGRGGVWGSGWLLWCSLPSARLRAM